MKKRLYLASPLFNPQELQFNEVVCEILSHAFSVYLPQRDGVLIPGNVFDDRSFTEMSRTVYRSDVDAVQNSDILFAVLDGRVMDEGAAFELGFGAALGKRCVGLLTDKRVLLPYGMNPMIRGGLSEIFRSLEEVRRWVSSV